MNLWTSLEPASATVDPGGATTVRLRLRNTGDVVDEYRFEVVGALATWAVVVPPVLRLYPGTTGSVDLTFSPPRTPDATAGPSPYAVRITPTEHPEATTIPEGNLTITPFVDVRAELVPPTVKARFRGRPRLAIDNMGNTKLTASVRGSDNGDQLSYDIHPSNVQIEPGRAAFVKATLKPRQIIWFGSQGHQPYKLAVQRSGVAPLDVEGMYVQKGFLPRWLATLLSVLTALTIAFVMLWIAYKPQVLSAAKEKQATDFSTLAPPISPTPDAPKAPSNEPAASEPAAPEPAASPPAPQNSPESGDDGQAARPEATQDGPSSVVPANNVLLQNTATKKCADIPSEGNGEKGGRVQQFTCIESADDNQLWNLEVRYSSLGPGGSALFQIRNAKDQYCMDLPGSGAQSIHAAISEADCVGTTDDNQLWWIDKQDSGAYWIRNFASNDMCLEVAGNESSADEVRLLLFYCTNTDDQEWQIVSP
ncbi:RICIN domain-containing protein [Streptomyces sp. NPDC005811]|uniref:RICIN domain-containing protein n=1 Tax=Streptomyces sp. NPDC005811 TaxID=3154565 RepID=UPI00340541A0